MTQADDEAPHPMNRAERRAAARGRKGASAVTGGAGKHGAHVNGPRGAVSARLTGKSAAGTDPHAHNRAAQGREGANRH